MTQDSKTLLARALSRIEGLQAELKQERQRGIAPIAVIGMACRFPGGATPEAFWETLENGTDCIREVPDSRRIGPWPPGVPRWAGLIDQDPMHFDAPFFGISTQEAESMDPQQRLLLEVSWEALERSGLAPHTLKDSPTGVFVGLSAVDHMQRILLRPPETRDAYEPTGNMAAVAAGRLSYTLGLHGPAVTLDTACSSSLVSVHLACQSLRSGECGLALAGGVHLILSEQNFFQLARLQALAPDGRCRTFDASATGFVRGEGCGLVVLKRLEDAQRDGNPILGILRSSAVNQDGRSTGLTAPNVLSQERLLRQALSLAGVEPAALGYIECHGTGTPLGDPIEVDALRAVFGAPRRDGSKLYLGAVKTHIGHLEAAAGVAGLIRTLLALQRRTLTPNLHLRHLNPRLRLGSTPLVPLRDAVDWTPIQGKRLAGVSSFGMSGTNAHVILEEAPAVEPARTVQPTSGPLPLVLSGHTPGALRAQAGQLKAWIEQQAHHPDARAEAQDLANSVAYTLACGRSPLAHRCGLLFRRVEQLPALLDAVEAGADTSPERPPDSAWVNARRVMLFSGQGSQFPGMARMLYDVSARFRERLTRWCEQLNIHLDRPLLPILLAEAGTPEASLLQQTGYTQPALFALEVALLELWESWGIRPDLVLGHSVGETAAAYAAGVLSPTDACTLVTARARLMQALPPGGVMAALEASDAEVRPRLVGLEQVLAVACVNSPRDTVISGTADAVHTVARSFERQGRRVSFLPVSHAFHSPLMVPTYDALREVARGLRFNPPRIPLISTVTGKQVSAEELRTPEYWVRQILEPVRFLDAVRTMHAQGATLCLELGPQAILSHLGQACLEGVGGHPTCFLPSLRKGRDDAETLLHALLELHVRGTDVDWKAWFAPLNVSTQVLPTYPFQRSRYSVTWEEGPSTSPQVRPQDAAPEAFRLVWKQLEPPALPMRPGGRWLLLAEPGPFVSHVQRGLQRRGVEVELFLLPEHGEPALRKTEISAALLRAQERPGGLAGIIDLWGIALTPDPESSGLSLLERTRPTWEDSLTVIPHLGVSEDRLRPRLVLVTQRAQAILEHDVIRPEQAIRWGMGGCLLAEHPELRPLRVDLEDAGPEEAEALVAWALSSVSEDRIGLRRQGAFGARLEPWKPPTTPVPMPVMAQASYLITGGLGALGLSLAEALVRAGAGHLVLLGRRPIHTEHQQAAVASMRAAGAQVTVVQGDLAEDGVITSILAELPDSFPLRGVVHAAGVLEDGLLRNQTTERFLRVLRPKVAGAWNLHQATRGMALDFFVLYSSAAALFGNPGQGSYAAANAFLDALAQARRSNGLPGLSLGWGPFEGEGMAKAQDQLTGIVARGFGRLSVEQGVRLFFIALNQPLAYVAPMLLKVQTWIEEEPRLAGWPFLEMLLAQSGQASAEHAPAASPLGASAVVQPSTTATPTGARMLALDALLLRHVWRPTAPVEAPGFFPSGRWLLLADRKGLANRIERALEDAGASVVRVELRDPSHERARPGTGAAGPRPWHSPDPLDVESMRELVNKVKSHRLGLRGIVYAWGLDSQAERHHGAPDQSWLGLLTLTQVLGELRGTDIPRLYLLTQQAVDPTQGEYPDSDPAALRLDQALHWGLGAVVQAQLPSTRCQQVDVSSTTDDDEARTLVQELLADTEESRLLLRGPQRYVGRLTPWLPLPGPGESLVRCEEEAFQLERLSTPALPLLRARPVNHLHPATGQVMVACAAVALRPETLPRSGESSPAQGPETIPQVSHPLGVEPPPTCPMAGTVLSIGPEVTRLSPGDRVVGWVPWLGQSHVIGSADAFVTTRLEPEQAVAVAQVFPLAYDALLRLGDVHPGQQLLVLDADSALGTAVVQVARAAGAQVYAVLSRTVARDTRSAALDAAHILTHDALEAGSNGPSPLPKVEVIVRAGTSTLPAPWLELLLPGGILLDLCCQHPPPASSSALSHVVYPLSLDACVARRLKRLHTHFHAATEALDAGKLLAPTLDRAGLNDVARLLQGQQDESPNVNTYGGSSVCTATLPVLALTLDPATLTVPRAERGKSIRGTWWVSSPCIEGLITGAQWLVAQGATGLAILAPEASLNALRDALSPDRLRDISVTLLGGDTPDPPSVEALLALAHATLEGILHVETSSGLHADAPGLEQAALLEQRLSALSTLAQVATQHAVEQLLVVTSGAAVAGMPEAGVDGALDAWLLAAVGRRLRARTRVTLVQWVDMEPSTPQTMHAPSARATFQQTAPEQRYQALERLLASTLPQPVLWIQAESAQGATSRTAWDLPLYAELMRSRPGGAELGAEWIQTLLQLPAEEAVEQVGQYIRQQVARILRAQDRALHLDTPVASLGLDSLSGLELIQRLEAELGVRLPMALLFQQNTMRSLAEQVMLRVFNRSRNARLQP